MVLFSKKNPDSLHINLTEMKFNKPLVNKVEIQVPLFVILMLSLCCLPLLTIRRTAEGLLSSVFLKIHKLRFAIYLMLR